jgi:hypothetical protein
LAADPAESVNAATSPTYVWPWAVLMVSGVPGWRAASTKAVNCGA